MKLLISAVLLAGVILSTGCVSTVDNRTTPGVPFVKDKIEGRYERPIEQVFNAAKTVVSRQGALINESTVYNQTNAVRTIEGKIQQVNVWVRVYSIDPKVTGVVVQTRNKSGAGDLYLAHEVEKQIALELVK